MFNPDSLKLGFKTLLEVITKKSKLESATPLDIVLLPQFKDYKLSNKKSLLTYLTIVKYPQGTSRFMSFSKKKDTYSPLLKLKNDSSLEDKSGLFLYKFTNNLNIKEGKLGHFKNLVWHSFSEIIANILEHSKATTVYLMFQSWGASLEICIFDNGQGFKESLNHGGHNFTDDIQAIESVFFNRVSSKINDVERGFGIKTIKDALLNDTIKGEMILISNDSYIYASTKETESKFLPTSIVGSCLCLRFNNLI